MNCSPQIVIKKISHTHTVKDITDFNQKVGDLLVNYLPLSGGALTGDLSATDIFLNNESLTDLKIVNYDSNYDTVNTLSASWGMEDDGDTATIVQNYSANWNDIVTVVTNNSAVEWNYHGTDIKTLTGDWQDTLTVVSNYSAIWVLSGLNVETDPIFTSWVTTNSALFLNTYNTVQSNSAVEWNYQGTDIKTLTGDWQNTFTNFSVQSANNASVYSNVYTNSANNLSNYTTLNSNSANWNSIYSTVNSNSALDWNYQGTDVKSLTSNWQDTSVAVQLTSATWNNKQNGSVILSAFASLTSLGGVLYNDGGNLSYIATSIGGNGSDDSGKLLKFDYTGSINGHFQGTIDSGTSNNFIVIDNNGLTIGDSDNSTSGTIMPPVSGGEFQTWYLPSRSGTFALTGDIKDLNIHFSSQSANNLSNYTTLNSNSANWDSVYSNTNSNSANNLSVYSEVNSTSGNWDIAYNQSNIFANNSANYNNIATTVQNNSAIWALSGGTVSVENDPIFTSWAQSNSANYQATFVAVQTNSAINWNYQGTDIKSLTSSWQNTFTDFSTQSANNLSVYSNNNSNSANNVSVYTTVNTNSATWASGIGGSGGGKIYYFNRATLAQSPTTNLPVTAWQLGNLGLSAQTIYTSGTISQVDYTLVAGFVTDILNPNTTSIPGGIWDFNIWGYSNATTNNPTVLQAVVYIYDGINAPVLLSTSNDDTLTNNGIFIQQSMSCLVPQKTVSLSDRIYVEIRAKATTNHKTVTLAFGDYTPSHLHTTISYVGGTGLVKVVDGVTQTSASLLVDVDVASAANINQSKISGLTTVVDNVNSSYTTLNTQSANNLSNYTTVNTNSANWNSVYSNTNSNSANNMSVYSTVNTNSAVQWNYQGIDVKSLTGNWQNTFTDFSVQSANNLSNYTTVNSNSANWLSNYTSFNTQSGNNASVYSYVNNSSANNLSNYTTVNTYSATWNAGGGSGIDTEVRALTSNWQHTYSTVLANSATWGTGGSGGTNTINVEDANVIIALSMFI